LIASGAEINAVNARGETALMLAAGKGRTRPLARLLAAGAKSDLRDNAGRTAISFAVRGCHAPAVQLIAVYGADLGVPVERSEPLLLRAAATCDAATLEVLIEQGADANQRDSGRRTALWH